MSKKILWKRDSWEWFGNPAHFICARDCRFHMATKVGPWIVSTVGEYWPPESVREIMAKSRGITLEGKGDYRDADYMQKIGYGEIGCDRKYETMVFLAGKRCTAKGCKCGLPSIDGSEVAFDAYNDAGAATKGHLALCEGFSKRERSNE